MDIDEVKISILKLYSETPRYYTSELADRLDVEPKVIVKAIKELKEEGKF